MLLERDVVEAVCTYLEGRGYEILQRALTSEHGDDIVAKKGEQRLIIEAKGQTSSNPRSKRYGQPFSSTQVFSHVAKAVLKALRVTSRSDDSRHDHAAIAFPDTPLHRGEINAVSSALRHAGVAVLWVDEQGRVAADSPWDI